MWWNASRTWKIPKGGFHQGFAFIMSANLEDHGTGKDQSSSQLTRRVVPKNVLAIRQLHSSPMLVRSCLKSCILGFSIVWTKNFQMSKLGWEKEEELDIKLPTFTGLYRNQGNFRKSSHMVSSTRLKPLTVWIMTNCGKLLERWEYQTITPVSWEILPDWQIFPSVHLGLFYTS